MAIVGIPQAFSGSTGGEPIKITANEFPGQVVHANAAEDLIADVIEAIVAVNPNPEQIPLYWWITGPGLTPPTTVNEAQRVDIPPTNEGREPTPLITPLVLKPGYEVRMLVPSYNTPLGQEAITIQGEVTHYEVTDPQLVVGPGYGGLVTITQQPMADIPASSWATVPFEQGLLSAPFNVEQDPANNRFRFTSIGVWNLQTYGVISYKKKSADRYAYFRFFDETAGQPYSSDFFPISLENGNNFGTWSVGVAIEVDAITVNQWYRLELGDTKQIGAADVPLEDIILAKAGITAVKIAELQP